MATQNQMTKRANEREQTVARIAKEVLMVETIETRNSDRLDFYDVAIWQIEAALTRAYEAGRASRS